MEGRIGGMTDGQGKPSDGCCCTVQVGGIKRLGRKADALLVLVNL